MFIAFEGSTVTSIFNITTAGVKYCMVAIKSRPDFISVLLYFFWSIGINDSYTFSIENRIPLKLVLGGVRDVALFIFSHESADFTYLFWFGLEIPTFTGIFIVALQTGELKPMLDRLPENTEKEMKNMLHRINEITKVEIFILKLTLP